ncbi:MAG: hypothetical protein A2W25_05975 [candidate division Zixibacteria bacterium RBG_16_53_22]|nr:MAG: hypothetical protein A2W25_05975 [candidate division Zixibacteria bacterium RBG_16_53_22]
MADKYRLLFLAAATALISSCGIFIVDKSNNLNPILVFGDGASFLDNASTLAIRGRIEFKEGRAITQSGSFQLFLNGPDSASFLIEGPFGADAFKMVILGDAANILTNEGWTHLTRGQSIGVAEYGISNISPFLIGPVIFPQYYPVDVAGDDDGRKVQLRINGTGFSSRIMNYGGYFNLIEPRTGLISEYTNRKNLDSGFYPARVEILNPQSGNWRIILEITRLKINAEIPPAVWAPD